ncbi:MAG: KTSC domain-containing protein [Lachnospiraceae bacterium]|nr:KTSC domain-containing protein [Lachnospiraceae bacterium]
MGYDPQCALLEVKLTSDGHVRRYRDVPEDVWYGLRENFHPDVYFRRYICGRYHEEKLPFKPEKDDQR